MLGIATFQTSFEMVILYPWSTKLATKAPAMSLCGILYFSYSFCPWVAYA